jgi:DNA-binding MarR family transcriptional regulator
VNRPREELDEFPNLEAFLTYHLSRLYRLWTRRSTRFIAEHFEITLAEWWMLGQLATYSPTTVRELSERTFTDKAQVSRAVDQLCRRGWAERRPDPNDRRSALFFITELGRAKYEEIMPHRQEIQAELLSQLTAEEKIVLKQAIEKLTEYLNRSPG